MDEAPKNEQFFKANKEQYRAAVGQFKKKFTPTLYLELTGNALNYPTELSSKFMTETYNISRDAYNAAVAELIELRFLIPEPNSKTKFKMYRTQQSVEGKTYNQSVEGKTNNPLKEKPTTELKEKPTTGSRKNPQEIDKKDNTNKIDSILSAEEDVRKQLEAKGFTPEEVNALIAGKPQSVWNKEGYGLCFTAAYQKEKLAAVKAKVIAFEAAKELHHAQNATMYEPTATTWVEEEPVRIIKKRGMA